MIVGNGFDKAHGLPTGYKDFIKNNSNNPIVKQFQLLSENYGDSNDTWYLFENQIEFISNNVFSKMLNNSKTNIDYKNAEENMTKYNQLFTEISDLLMNYLQRVYDNHKIEIIDSLKDEFSTNDSFTISFNYTDTLKQYTQNYEYIHGNIAQDSTIVLGFANDNYPDTVTYPFNYYNKALLRFRLMYIRFLIENGLSEEQDKYLKEFEPHLVSLFSGKGDWNFKITKNKNGNEIFDTSEASDILKKFYETHKRLIDYQAKDLSQVNEIVIIGHGLESDKGYFMSLSEQAKNISTATIYTYQGEEEIDKKRKEDFIKTVFHLNTVKWKNIN